MSLSTRQDVDLIGELYLGRAMLALVSDVPVVYQPHLDD